MDILPPSVSQTKLQIADGIAESKGSAVLHTAQLRSWLSGKMREAEQLCYASQAQISCPLSSALNSHIALICVFSAVQDKRGVVLFKASAPEKLIKSLF